MIDAVPDLPGDTPLTSVRPPGPDGRDHQATLACLRAEFPRFSISREVTGGHARYVARRLSPGTSPHTVVTADPGELRAALGQHEYPQAIADDYPGWAAGCRDGQWTAWCPAITVHASTPSELRALIEQAIGGDSDT